MTLLKPTIRLNRLAIYKGSRTVFDATFHKGVNIIRGHNSSGKTTVLDFIAYSLGAEYIPWKQEALFCDYSLAEVALNDKCVTFKRDINDKPLNPLYIFWGGMAEALNAPFSSWELYGFKRSSSKLSFTQAILLAMDLPEAQGDGASNLTMHQFLRVLYADQPSLHSPIFRNDSFDSALTRETVGSYLSGIFDDSLYVAQLNRRELVKEVERLDSELKSIFTVLAKSGQKTDIEFLGTEIKNAETKRDGMLQELSRLKRERTVETSGKAKASETQLRSQLDNAKKSLSQALNNLAVKELNVEDSTQFINEIELRLAGLADSGSTRGYFESMSFAFCPCCLSAINSSPSVETGNCALCKTPLKASAGDAQLLRMRNELRLQLVESKQLIKEAASEIANLRSEIPTLKRTLKSLEQQFEETTQSWSTDLETAVEEIARNIGAIDQEISSLYNSQRLAVAITELQARRNELRTKIAELESKIEALEYSQEQRKREVTYEVAATLGRLLREDLHRTDLFHRAEDIQFSFTDNKVYVESETQFSESSTAVLRHLFHLSLLSASTRIRTMRLPRFLMLDGIEDGGMELERSHRLQEIIVNECSKFECEYQVIFATSQIAPKLDIDDYVVASAFTEGNRSLRLN